MESQHELLQALRAFPVHAGDDAKLAWVDVLREILCGQAASPKKPKTDADKPTQPPEGPGGDDQGDGQ